ncbi:cell division cycle protein 16 homolog [Nilaparvata lugens]|uniref:cell division cycle protein 16 homolog n=1 Tax=Nilaparvata lugens TaxID=108931 RepID=UPI00193CD5FB|nr:cell division cycle protein 16 homolog [Nilaparvata lugens]
MAGENSIDDDGSKNLNIDGYRKLIRTYIDLHLYNSALFWADKVVSLSGDDPSDIYWLAHCMFLMKQYHRASLLIKNKGLHKTNKLCQYLAGRCLLEAKELSEALAIVSGGDANNTSFSVPAVSSPVDESFNMEGTSILGYNLQSALLYLKGQIYEASDKRGLACDCYKQALHEDVHCYNAFEALVKHQMLSASEEKELLDSLPRGEDDKIVTYIYESLLNKYQAVPEAPPASTLHQCLEDNLDMTVAKAERFFYACSYKQCIRITEEVLKKDPYHTSCLPIHISCLVELKKTNKLFYLAHDLVDLQPESAVSWFAVGCYYYLIGKSDPARRYLGKATSLDRLFGPAWLAYGHSFASENEHDQAMAAYFKASQLMKGCHLPLLYIGLECGLTNNIDLAEKFFSQAQNIAPNDPFVIHEKGVVAFQNRRYHEAESLFKSALDKVLDISDHKKKIAEKWEPLLNNLGHTSRKLHKYSEALGYHQQALLLAPLNPSTLSCIGFVQALLGRNAEAVETFHKALGQRRDNSFSTTMLNYVMEQLMEETPPFAGADSQEHLDILNTVGTSKMFKIKMEDEQSGSAAGSPWLGDETPVANRTTPSTFVSPSPGQSRSIDEVEMQDSFQDENTS